MSGLFTMTVSVTFIDEATGERFAASNVPVAQLPDTFAIDTTLELAGQRYAVLRAEPATKAQFVRANKLTVFVRRVEVMDPEKILFSLPTICGAALPETALGRAAGGACVLHEDDWRQCEMVAVGEAANISAELSAIRQIYENEVVEAGFRKLHVRERIGRPLPGGIRWQDVAARLGKHDALGGVAFGDIRKLVTGAAAATLRNGVVIWGVESGGELTALCIQNLPAASASTVSALKRVADELALVLVDWCSCCVYGPGGMEIEGAAGSPWDAGA